MHNHAYRPLSGSARPHAPPCRRSSAARRAAGGRHRRAGRDPPVRRLAPSAHPPRSGLRLEAGGWSAAPLLSEGGAFPRACREAREVPQLVGSASRPLRSRARGTTEEPENHAQGETRMNDSSKSAVRPKVVVERTYRARVEELWELWTTKKGFESWWGPEGFRVEVHTLEARVGGALRYDMIADAPEQIEAMQRMGHATSHKTRGTFSEIIPHVRLAITYVIDFLPGVKPYDSMMVVEFFPAGESVRMVVTLDPMQNEEFTRMSTMGFTSQLTKLDKRFGGRKG